MLISEKGYCDGVVIMLQQGHTATLQANSKNAAAYQWYKNGQPLNNATQKNLTVSDPGTYTVVAFNAEGCPSFAAEPVEVRITAPPVDLAVVKQSESRQVHIGEPYEYLLSVRNKSNQTATNTTLRDSLPDRLDFVSVKSVTTGLTNYDTKSHTVIWTIGDMPANSTAEMRLMVKTDTYGTVINAASVASNETDANPSDNRSTDTKQILGLTIPNVFTPNGDGVNDTFTIPQLDNYDENEITIFNRWGNSVFHERNYHNEWTGDGLSDGTYYYILKTKNAKGAWEEYHGYLTLLRSNMTK